MPPFSSISSRLPAVEGHRWRLRGRDPRASRSSCCSSPPRRPTRRCRPGLDPAQTGKITAALDEQGIAYELQYNGTALAVEKAMAQARIALAGQGVARGGGGSPASSSSTSRSSAPPTSSSRSPTSARSRARSPSTISGVQGVSGAPVQLVLPEDDLFADERRRPPRPSCSQLRRHARAGAVRGIAQLVVLLGQGPEDRERHDHRRLRPLLWPNGDGAAARPAAARTSRPPRRATPASSRPRSTRCSPARSARQGPGAGQRRPQRRQDHARRS